MAEKQDFTKFKFAEKFDCLPLGMRLAPGAANLLDLSVTHVDMIPSGLKGIRTIIFSKEPLYISPDFDGEVLVPGGNSGICFMANDLIKQAKVRYSANQEMVERPRYIQEEKGSLALCSLPKNMHVVLQNYANYYLDLTETDIVKKQNLEGFKDIILYPKKNQLTINATQKILHHHGRQMVHQKPRIKE
ncbi:MAG: hypothetical protein J6T55_00200 [Alphaproteobacteria bacterium]|nr:hypothetical protein [Alphaproteobacteria bacterium]